jgi:hypothetical protein
MKKSRSRAVKDRSTLSLPDLASAIGRRELILFVGGGISQNVGLPDFKELVRYIAREMELDESALETTDYPIIAEAYSVTHGGLGALRSWMDTTWHPPTIDVTKSQIHNLIIDLNFSVIYTTNYDRWLETAFGSRRKPFHKISSMADFARSHGEATEIIKFHGDFDNDDSLVLTETSYFQRMNFESALDIRLRSDCLARPLLFVGYSLQDINTRYLLFRLQELWKSSNFAEQRPKSYIFATQQKTAEEIVLRSRGIEPIVWEDDDPGRATKDFLESLLRLVRQDQPLTTKKKARKNTAGKDKRS